MNKLGPVVLGAVVMALAALSGRAPAQPATTPVASQDDCEIMTLLGRKLLGWGERAPDLSMFPIFYRLSGRDYVEQCPWQALGVEALPPGKPDLRNMQYFTEPMYAAGGTKATLAYVLQMSRTGPNGPEEPYVNETICTLHKRDGQWAVDACKDGKVG